VIGAFIILATLHLTKTMENGEDTSRLP
jgi:hypothetical protein